MDGAAAIARRNIETWSHLGETVRAGRPVGSPPSPGELAQFFSTLVRAIFPMSFMGSKSAVAALDKKARGRISAILDVAAGACAWSIPFAQAIPKARVTVVDFPDVTNVAREYTTRFGVGDRYDYLEGNLRETDFGRERFDLVILGHIIHGEGREQGRETDRAIFRRAEAQRNAAHRRVHPERRAERAGTAGAGPHGGGARAALRSGQGA